MNIKNSKLCSEVFIVLAMIFLISCEFSEDNFVLNQDFILTDKGKFEGSSSLGNFITTAVLEAENLDLVFYPSEYLDEETFLFISPNPTQLEVENVLNSFEEGPKDALLIGSMKGKYIKKFILERSREKYKNHLQVAGLSFDLGFVGGALVDRSIWYLKTRDRLQDEVYYNIAIADGFYCCDAFPGYLYRNNFNFNFKPKTHIASVRASVKKYLESTQEFPDFYNQRVRVRNKVRGNAGFKRIHQIQGTTHISPLIGYRVQTEGVVTARGDQGWYPDAVEFYIQTKDSDEDPRTSEGVKVRSFDYNLDIRLGDTIQLSGVVTEDFRTNGMSETMLDSISDVKVDRPIYPEDVNTPGKQVKYRQAEVYPEPVILGSENRKIPTEQISSYYGNVNDKKSLDLHEGLDFWESIEGMRVQVKDLKVRGFRGGREELADRGTKGYLTLYVTTGDEYSSEDETDKGGLLLNDSKEVDDHNPEIFEILSNHFSRISRAEDFYKKGFIRVGDTIEGEVSGVMTYSKNLFGGGSYSMVMPDLETKFSKYVAATIGRESEIDFGLRSKSSFVTKNSSSEDRALTMATFNVENLAGYDSFRLKHIANVVRNHMFCPDVIGFVEIQDYDGQGFTGDISGELTLKRLIEMANCETNYDTINLDPFENAEGGQPGGNIRVAYLYNKEKLGFKSKLPKLGFLPQAAMSANTEAGLLYNPAKIGQFEASFENTRRSLVVEFQWNQKNIYMILSHLKSKVGDTDPWGAIQPYLPKSDVKRANMAREVSDFIVQIKKQDKNSIVFSMGDFNSHPNEPALKLLEQAGLSNSIFLMDEDKRYTTNHNGNSVALDYIFFDNDLKSDRYRVQAENLNVNSNYMGRISDHDPVMLRVDLLE